MVSPLSISTSPAASRRVHRSHGAHCRGARRLPLLLALPPSPPVSPVRIQQRLRIPRVKIGSVHWFSVPHVLQLPLPFTTRYTPRVVASACQSAVVDHVPSVGAGDVSAGAAQRLFYLQRTCPPFVPRCLSACGVRQCHVTRRAARGA